MGTKSMELDTIINEMFAKYPATAETQVNEVEFSIVGHRSDKEQWNMGISTFRRLLTKLSKDTGIAPVQTIMLTASGRNNERVRITDIQKIQKFCVYNDPIPDEDDTIFDLKTRVEMVDFDDFGIRLKYSNEKQMDLDQIATFKGILKDTTTNKFYRHAQRYSIQLPVKIGERGYIRFDFTSVKQGSGYDFRNAQLTGPISTAQELYEIEVEMGNISSDEFRDLTIQNIIRENLNLHFNSILMELNGGMILAPKATLIEGLNKYISLVSMKSLNDYRDKKLAAKNIKDLYQSSLIGLADHFMTVNISTLSDKHVRENILLKLENGKEVTKDAPYLFTDKADGIRALLFIDDMGQAFVLTRTSILRQTSDKQNVKVNILQIFSTGIIYEAKELFNTILDGEFLTIQTNGKQKPYFLIFDIIINNGQDQTHTDFTNRVTKLAKFNFTQPGKDNVLNVQGKTFYEYTTENFASMISSHKFVKTMASHQLTKLTYNDKGISYSLDGIVFQPKSGPQSYWPVGKTTWREVYKWKSTYMSTVDLLVTYEERAGPPVVTNLGQTYGVFKAYANRAPNASQYKCCARMYNGIPRTETEDDSLGEPIRKGAIVECRLSLDKSGTGDIHWVPVRIRHDKTKANDMTVYDDLLNTIIRSAISLENLTQVSGGHGGSREVKVNTINREVSNLYMIKTIEEKLKLTESSQVKLLDLGCGKMKSATAWLKLSEKTMSFDVLGIDEADVTQFNTSLSQYIKSKSVKFKANIVHGNFTTDLKAQSTVSPYLALTGPFNVVTCNFAIHYAMASENSFKRFLENVSSNLTEGGLFIGSYMNKKSIISLANGKREITTRPDIWRIELFPLAKDQTYGAQIDVSFIGLYSKHREYLIDVEDEQLKKLYAQYGLTLIEHAPFSSDSLEGLPEDEKKWFKLHYTFAFVKEGKELAPSRPKKSALTAVLRTVRQTLSELSAMGEVQHIDTSVQKKREAEASKTSSSAPAATQQTSSAPEQDGIMERKVKISLKLKQRATPKTN